MFERNKNKASAPTPEPDSTQQILERLRVASEARVTAFNEKLRALQASSKAKELLAKPEVRVRFKDALAQLEGYYTAHKENGAEIRPLFAGLTPSGRFIECSIYNKSNKSDSDKTDYTGASEVRVFTYDLGSEVSEERLAPRRVVEAVIMRSDPNHIQVDSPEHPKPETGGRDRTMWNFYEAETITIKNLHSIRRGALPDTTYGYGADSPAITDNPNSPAEQLLPLEGFAEELN